MPVRQSKIWSQILQPRGEHWKAELPSFAGGGGYNPFRTGLWFSGWVWNFFFLESQGQPNPCYWTWQRVLAWSMLLRWFHDTNLCILWSCLFIHPQWFRDCHTGASYLINSNMHLLLRKWHNLAVMKNKVRREQNVGKQDRNDSVSIQLPYISFALYTYCAGKRNTDI